jgi:hypothetical protein
MSNGIAVPKASELAADTQVFVSYLENLGLPIDNVIATTDERSIIAENLPQFITSLPTEERKEARYLSKFIGATAIGLFDAALNYVWNEVVLNLRKKAAVYGVDLFFDAAVGGNLRASFKSEEDLAGLKDSVLLDTCRKLELLSDVVYKKIVHILTMRNEVAASHPNVEAIGGYELLGWLQTCVKDVLQDAPSDSAIRIKALVENLRSREDVIDKVVQERFIEELKFLSLPHVNNLLITIFGMHVASDSSQVLRKNISFISKAIWDCSSDTVKFSIGAKIDGYRTNLQQDKLNSGTEFLRITNGLRYESLPARTIALNSLADSLLSAHQGYDNYYNEPQYIQEILRYCHKADDIPSDVREKIINTVVKCRLGRGLSYCDGVSPSGRPFYDQFIGILDDSGIVSIILAIFTPSINASLGNRICQNHLQTILFMCKNLAVSDRLTAMLDFLLADIANAHWAHHKQDFKELCTPFIVWK